MVFGIPNEPSAAFADQAEPDAVDFDALVAAFDLTGVVSGCAVTAQGAPDMTVAVAAGTVKVGGATVAVTAGNVTIGAAHAINPRFDLVVVSNAGTKSVVAGTASANPVFPAIPASSVLLAAVYVPANDTTINSNQIIDKRVVLRPPAGASGGTATGVKQSDESRAVTAAEDTAFNIAVDPTSKYLVEIELWVTEDSGTPNLEYQFVGPAGITGQWFHVQTGASAATGPTTTFATDITVTTTTGIPQKITIMGLIETVGTGGTFKFYWGSTSAAGMTVYKGSFVRLTKV